LNVQLGTVVDSHRFREEFPSAFIHFAERTGTKQDWLLGLSYCH
jgi:hypothetical protein